MILTNKGYVNRKFCPLAQEGKYNGWSMVSCRVCFTKFRKKIDGKQNE